MHVGCFSIQARTAHCNLVTRTGFNVARARPSTLLRASRRTQLQRRACSKTSTAKKLDATKAAAITRRCMPQAAEPPFARLLSSARRRRIRRRVAVRYRTSAHFAQWLRALCTASLPEAFHTSSRPLRRLRRRIRRRVAVRYRTSAHFAQWLRALCTASLPEAFHTSSRPLRRLRRRHHQARHARCGSLRRLQRRFIYAQRLTVKVSRPPQNDRDENTRARRMKPAKPASANSARTATFARRRRPVRATRSGFSASRPRRR